LSVKDGGFGAVSLNFNVSPEFDTRCIGNLCAIVPPPTTPTPPPAPINPGPPIMVIPMLPKQIIPTPIRNMVPRQITTPPEGPILPKSKLMPIITPIRPTPGYAFDDTTLSGFTLGVGLVAIGAGFYVLGKHMKWW
jgi:hypothetical protein